MTRHDITFDSNYLYINEEKFFPIFKEMEDLADSLDSVNGVVIRVNCCEGMELDWKEPFLLAERAVELGKWILWDLDFGFHQTRLFLEDSTEFFSKAAIIEQFVKVLWTPFQNQSLGACLYKGGVDFSKLFLWTEQHESNYLEKTRESLLLKSDSSFEDKERRLFAADVFSDYLHRLSSCLPETLLPFCFFDVSQVDSASFLSVLLSKERFQHLLLALKKSKLPLGCLNWEEGGCFGGWVGRGLPYFSAVHDVPLAICIPLQENVSPSVLNQMQDAIDRLDLLGIPYRVISELYLNESWDGVDELVVFRSATSSSGLRKLKGFVAAGGKILYADVPLEIGEEESLFEFVAK